MRVAFADDSLPFRRGLRSVLTEIGFDVTVEAHTGDELLASVSRDPPEMVIVDIAMPPTRTDEGLRTVERLRATQGGMPALLLSAYAHTHYAMRLLEIGGGGLGYLLKDRVEDVGRFREDLLRLAAGGIVVEPEIGTRLTTHRKTSSALQSLTDQERTVLRLMAEGRSNAGIAKLLFLAPKTVETHVASIFRKLQLPASTDDNRRILAVVKCLHSTAQAGDPPPTR